MSLFLRFWVIAMSVVVLAGPVKAQTGAPAKSSASSSPTPTPAPTPIPLPDVVAQADATNGVIRELENDSSVAQARAAVQSTLPTVVAEIDLRSGETTELFSPNASLESIEELQPAWDRLGERLGGWSRNLTRAGTQLDSHIKRLTELTKTWELTAAAAKTANAPAGLLDQINATLSALHTAQAEIENRRSETLRLQAQVAEQQNRVNEALNSVHQAREGAQERLWVKDSAPLWARQPRPGISANLSQASQTTFSAQASTVAIYARKNVGQFFIHAALIGLSILALRWARRAVRDWVKADQSLQRSAPVFEAPVAAAMALSLLFLPFIYPHAPRLLRAGFGSLALIPTVMLLRRLIEHRHFPILYASVAFNFIDQLRLVLATMPTLARWVFAFETVAGIAVAAFLVQNERRDGKIKRAPPFIRIAARLITVLLLVALAANVLGYVSLAVLLGGAVLRSAYIAVLIYAGVRVLEGLSTLALEVRPLTYLHMVRHHRAVLRQRIVWVLHCFGFWAWFNVFLNLLQVQNPFYGTATAVLSAPLSFGSLQLTFGHVVAFVIAVWASFLVSRFLRFLLEQDVYERLRLPRGLPYALSTLLHYLVLLVGFFVALAALGLDFTKFTILAGAFSVGIGFGMQNVINNFVSGLILLFERPINVGDVIQVDANTGSVEKIGIRASVIRTMDGSEIIIPNGTLISGQVTNWTFSDRQRVIILQVNVAREANTTRAAELLTEAALAHPKVARQPAPLAYVVSLSAVALTVELRAWTEQYDEWMQIRSDLVIAVNQSLVRDGIALA
ncbi:MAG TPA: mechanosensitive ion channel domain-containing protein [Chthoniobacterales bacterium]